MTMRVLILAGGPAVETDAPSVLLAERSGELLVERIARQLGELRAQMIFVLRQQDIGRHHIDDVVRLAVPGAEIVVIGRETGGAACTALLAVHHFAPDEELLVLAANEFLDIDYPQTIAEFRARELDAATVVFPSLHPRYSYVALDDAGLVVEAAEKRPISRLAAAGFYWYRRAGDFVDAAEDMIRKDAQVDGAFYLSLTFNQLVLRQKRIGVREIDGRRYIPLKSKHQIAVYEGEISGERTR
ncbi:MAG: hypothetical protein GX458_23445 [Phyllobacteriaceae bacterium]|nr:hypothetical protein [Phyllobacteriaceae bacterium]